MYILEIQKRINSVPDFETVNQQFFLDSEKVKAETLEREIRDNITEFYRVRLIHLEER